MKDTLKAGSVESRHDKLRPAEAGTLQVCSPQDQIAALYIAE